MLQSLTQSWFIIGICDCKYHPGHFSNQKIQKVPWCLQSRWRTGHVVQLSGTRNGEEDVWNLWSVPSIVARFFIRTCRTKANGSAGVGARSFYASSRHLPAEKVSADESWHLHCRARPSHGRILAPISIIHPSVQQPEHTCARERARASRDRGGKFHSRIHSLANRFPAWVEYIEIIWANTTSSVMKFAEGLASSRLSCLRLPAPELSLSSPCPFPSPSPLLPPAQTRRYSFTSSSWVPPRPRLVLHLHRHHPASRISPSDICSKSVQ